MDLNHTLTKLDAVAGALFRLSVENEETTIRDAGTNYHEGLVSAYHDAATMVARAAAELRGVTFDNQYEES